MNRNTIIFHLDEGDYALDLAKEQAYKIRMEGSERIYDPIQQKDLPFRMQKYYETMYKWNQWVSRRSKMFEGI